MIERSLLVKVEEICANSVEYSLGKDPEKRSVRHIPPHRYNHQQCHPPHSQIQSEGETWMFAERDKFAYNAGNHTRPEENENRPA